MKLFHWSKQSKKVNEVENVILNIGTASFVIKYKDGDIINYSVIDLVNQLEYLDKKMEEKVAVNIFFGLIGALFSITLFSGTILSSNVGVKVEMLKERFQPLENADKELENADKELENADKELEKENQLLRERILILEQRIN